MREPGQLLAAVALATGLVATTAPSAVADDGECRETGSAYTCTDRSNGNDGGNGNGNGSSNGNPAIFSVELTGEPGSEGRCWHITTGGSQTWAEAAETLAQVGENTDADGEAIAWETCPGAPTTPPVPDVWRSMLCPPPAPTPLAMAPGYAVPGQPGYLEIQGPQTVDIACLGETVTATARYVVRWGDGDETTTTSQGGPWPDGDVTHTYTTAGSVTVTVEAYWTGVWRETELPELPVPTTAQLPLQVRQVQAVRDR